MQLKHKPLTAATLIVLVTLAPMTLVVFMTLTPLQAYAAETNPAREMSTSSMPPNFDYFIEGIRNVHP